MKKKQILVEALRMTGAVIASLLAFFGVESCTIISGNRPTDNATLIDAYEVATPFDVSATR